MKKLITILVLLFIFKTGFSQPIANRTTGANTVGDPRLFTKLNLFIPRYADTTAANSPTNIGIDSCGAIIFTYDVNGMWVRQCNPKKWARAGSSTTPTLQQVITAGNLLTKVDTIDANNFALRFLNSPNYYFQTNLNGAGVQGFAVIAPGSFLFQNALGVYSATIQSSLTGSLSPYVTLTAGGTRSSTISVTEQGININVPDSGSGINVGPLQSSLDTTTYKPIVYDKSNNYIKYLRAWPITSSIPISSLTAATATNTINNANFTQEWQWNTLASTVFGLSLTSTSNGTTSLTGLDAILNISKTGVSQANTAIRLTASGGASNFAIYAASGDVYINQTTGLLQVGLAGTNKGVIKVSGNTSGTITIQPAAAAGTYTLTLPTTDGNANEFLQTDGSGVLTWAAAGSGTVTSFAFTDGSGFDGTVTNSTTTPTLALTTTISSGFVVYTTTAGAITGGASGIAINTATPEVDLFGSAIDLVGGTTNFSIVNGSGTFGIGLANGPNPYLYLGVSGATQFYTRVFNGTSVTLATKGASAGNNLIFASGNEAQAMEIYVSGAVWVGGTAVDVGDNALGVQGNLFMGGSTIAASATATFHIFNGTVPSASVADGVLLYSQDVAASSELKVRDEAGNVTVLSPHDFTGIPEGKSETMAWAYYSEKDGKYVNVDMLKLARLVEKLTGEKLVYIGDPNKKPNPKNK